MSVMFKVKDLVTQPNVNIQHLQSLSKNLSDVLLRQRGHHLP